MFITQSVKCTRISGVHENHLKEYYTTQMKGTHTFPGSTAKQGNHSSRFGVLREMINVHAYDELSVHKQN